MGEHLGHLLGKRLGVELDDIDANDIEAYLLGDEEQLHSEIDPLVIDHHIAIGYGIKHLDQMADPYRLCDILNGG